LLNSSPSALDTDDSLHPNSLFVIMIMTPTAALLLLVAPFLSLAQVQLPNPAWQPPDASTGRVQSQTSSPVNQRWSDLLGTVLYYYDIQRSGKLPADFRVNWRNNSVPADGSDIGIDLSGGFFDAGNYIKVSRILDHFLS
jgi:endoglucanase